MIAAAIMGFQPEEIPTFTWAWMAGMTPTSLDQIEVLGTAVDQVARAFVRANVQPCSASASYFGPPC